MSISKTGTMQMHQDAPMKKNVDSEMIMEASNDICDSVSNNGDSDNSVTSSSSSSSDLAEDASSSSPSFGPLYELSELMAQLPIKRGLSKCYDGKSQSFTSLASVGGLEDLAKKGSSYNQRMKSCRSYGWGLDGRKYGPKATITKRSSRGPFLSSLGSRGTSASSCRPSISMEKTF